MNKQIKFRAWNGETMFENVKDLSLHVDDEVMQFTGLIDNKGREIYIGDICVQYFCGKEESGPITLNPTQGYMVGIHCIWRHDIEVVGNIYQNSELLK